MAESIRALPVLMAIVVMLVHVSAAIRTPLLAGFFCLFPKKLFTNRWAWAAFVAGAGFVAGGVVYFFWRGGGGPGDVCRGGWRRGVCVLVCCVLRRLVLGGG